jgi:hypothetical protein
MPAESKKQRRAAGMAKAIQAGKMKAKPGTPSAKMAQMPPAALNEFAGTPEQGLPMKATPTGTFKKRAF